MAGLGRLDADNRPTEFARQTNARCDVLVIGAGPAGLAAAAAAARRGQGVYLVDDRAEPGGQLLHRGGTIEGGDWRAWAVEVVKMIERAGGRFLARATAYGVYDHNLVCVWQRGADAGDRLWRIRPKRIVLAAGAIERPLVLPDNDRPGVMSADAALHYLNVAATRVGERIAVVTNNDSAYVGAEALAADGADVTLFDLRSDGPKTALKRETSAKIDGVLGAPICEGLSVNGRARTFDCVLLSGGWSPSVHLYGQARGKLRYDETLGGAGSGLRRSRASRSRAPPTAPSRWTPRLPKAIAPAAASGAAPNAAGRPLRHRGRLAEGRRRRAPLDRLPERRHPQGRRAGRARGLCLGRAS